MRRRDFLCGLGILTGTLTGCIGQGSNEDDQPVDYIPPVAVTANDALPRTPEASLDVRWNSRVSHGVSTNDSFFLTVAGEGMKFLIFRLLLTNTGQQAIALSPLMFHVEINDTTYEYESWDTRRNLENVTLDPTDSLDGWLVYRIPHSVTNANYIVRQQASPSAIMVQFSHDDQLEIDAFTLPRESPEDD